MKLQGASIQFGTFLPFLAWHCQLAAVRSPSSSNTTPFSTSSALEKVLTASAPGHKVSSEMAWQIGALLCAQDISSLHFLSVASFTSASGMTSIRANDLPDRLKHGQVAVFKSELMVQFAYAQRA